MVRVYGPYTRPDGRKHVVHYDGISHRTQSYPRYLMEQHLGRALEEWEQVDHINNDRTDDRIENYQLLTQKENVQKSKKGIEYGDFICPMCYTEFKCEMRTYRHNQINRKRRGPYCSRSCAGRAGVVERDTLEA